jgi:hypothetical protein
MIAQDSIYESLHLSGRVTEAYERNSRAFQAAMRRHSESVIVIDPYAGLVGEGAGDSHM